MYILGLEMHKINDFFRNVGPSGRGGRSRGYSCLVASLSRTRLDSWLRSIRPFGRSSERRMQDSPPISHTSGCLCVRTLHSCSHRCSRKLSWIRYICVDLR